MRPAVPRGIAAFVQGDRSCKARASAVELGALGVAPYFGGRLGVPGAAKVFDEQGKIVDDKVRAQVDKYMAGFVAFVAASHRAEHA